MWGKLTFLAVVLLSSVRSNRSQHLNRSVTATFRSFPVCVFLWAVREGVPFYAKCPISSLTSLEEPLHRCIIQSNVMSPTVYSLLQKKRKFDPIRKSFFLLWTFWRIWEIRSKVAMRWSDRVLCHLTKQKQKTIHQVHMGRLWLKKTNSCILH